MLLDHFIPYILFRQCVWDKFGLVYIIKNYLIYVTGVTYMG